MKFYYTSSWRPKFEIKNSFSRLICIHEYFLKSFAATEIKKTCIFETLIKLKHTFQYLMHNLWINVKLTPNIRVRVWYLFRNHLLRKKRETKWSKRIAVRWMHYKEKLVMFGSQTFCMFFFLLFYKNVSSDRTFNGFSFWTIFIDSCAYTQLKYIFIKL